MFDVGGGELLLIVLAILLLFGPKKLPEVAQTIGKGMRKVKQAQAQFQSQLSEIQKEINTDDKSTTEKDFIPDNSQPVESSHKIGAYDQLDLDKNFVTGTSTPETENVQPDEEKSDDTQIEKVSTSKNNSTESDKQS